jgi:hypothetical protein
MNDRIGRLDAKLGVDRTATDKAARGVARGPFNARSVGGLPTRAIASAATLRAIDGANIPHEFGGTCFRYDAAITYFNGQTTMARMCAANIALVHTNDHRREQAMVSAAGEAAGAIPYRSQQV